MGVLEKMDKLMGSYYATMQNHSYFDENGKGKLISYVENHWWLMNNGNYLKKHNNFVCFDDGFPLNIEDENEKKKQIHKILKCVYKIATAENLKLSDLPIIKGFLSWIHILEIVHLEFDEKYKESLQTIIGQNALNDIPKKEELIKKLKEFQNEKNLTDDQYKWLLDVIE